MPLPVVAAAWAIAAAAGSGAGAGGLGIKKQRDASRAVKAKKGEFHIAEAVTAKHRADCEQAFTLLGAAKVEAMSEALVPFHAAFSQLKNVDFEADVSDENSPALDAVSLAEAGRLSMTALDALGGVAGAGAAAMLASQAATQGVMAVGAASTGTSLSALSGAAANNAMLAWMGGGSIASGGGGMALGSTMLTGIAAAPAVLVGGVFLFHKGRGAEARADQFAADVDTALAQHRQCQAVLAAAQAQAQDATVVLRPLTARLARTSGWLQSLVERQSDWRELDERDRERVREATILAVAASSLVHTPVMGDDGSLTSAIRSAYDRAAAIASQPADA
ncbi:hypothetical protein GKE82_11460 [Conexibacter sp. W3-3-2]|uniref:hypothetical protein n=1 Tax=Conexibacter sp. W3-3-2 TaxID=2675227 RepID=UPI0012B7893E|nr:hypothetical protein [Conexibacter sp. W3-3-2]MTD44892.1 hypothetical protein [Conexibacter sp. W3-3-2]